MAINYGLWQVLNLYSLSHYSDDEDNPEDEEDGDEDASAMAAVATAVTFGDISAVFKSPSRNSGGNNKGGKSVRGPSQQGLCFGHYQGGAKT